MSYITLYQSNFSQGELRDWALGRVDIAQYGNSAYSIKNMIVRPQGGLMKRPGTVYVSPVKDETQEGTRLVPFVYSDTDTYVLEFGDHNMRVYKNDWQVPSGEQLINTGFLGGLSGWLTTHGNVQWNGPGSVSIQGQPGTPTPPNTYANIYQEVFLSAGTYTLTVFKLSSANIFMSVWDSVPSYGDVGQVLDQVTGGAAGTVTSSTFTVHSEGFYYIGVRRSDAVLATFRSISLWRHSYIVDLSVPYSLEEVQQLQFAQTFDSLFVVHPDHPLQRIQRSSDTGWSIAEYILEDGPYYKISDQRYGGRGTGYTLTPSANSGSITVTSSSSLFVPEDVGRLVRYRTLVTDAWGAFRITQVNSGTSVDATVQKTLSGTAASSQWRMGAFSETTGYPRAITLSEQRLWLAGTRDQPQGVWASSIGDLGNFSPDNDEDKDEVDPDTAMDYVINDTRSNIIYSMSSLRGVNILTSGGVFLARSSLQGEAITPENLNIQPITKDSAAPTLPEVTGSNLYYSDEYGKRLLELGYSFQDDAFKSIDVGMLAEHRLFKRIKKIVSCRSPNYLIWVLDQEGGLSAVTYIKEQNVNAWTHQVLGGQDVFVEDIATLPGQQEDELWLIVRRTIDGQVRRYIEIVSTSRIDQSNVNSSMYLDCASFYSGSPTTTLSGLGHLEGEVVECFADGAVTVVENDGIVETGEIELQSEVEEAAVGLPYVSEIETNQLSSTQAASLLQGRTGRIHAAVLRLFSSYGGEVGINNGNGLEMIPELSSEVVMGEPIVPFTGDREILLPSEYTRNPRMFIRHSLPTPFNLLSITYKASVSNR